MPVYVHECKNGHRFDVFLKLSEYDTPQVCKCGEPSQRVIVPTMIKFDIAPWDSYVSPASGKLITSYKERERDMKETGCVDYDPGMKDVQRRKIKEADEKLDKVVDATVEKEFDAMPLSKKEKLENELKYQTAEYKRL